MRKAQQGKNYNFIWQAPHPISGTPSIAFYLEGGSVEAVQGVTFASLSSLTKVKAVIDADAIKVL